MHAIHPRSLAPRLLLLAAPLLAAAAGCGARSVHMREVGAPQAIDPDPATATVVFVRPTSSAFEVRATVVDGQGTYLGDSIAESHFAVRMPPGEAVLIAFPHPPSGIRPLWFTPPGFAAPAQSGAAPQPDALRATLEPGRVYHIEVAPRVDATGKLSVTLRPIAPRTEQWPLLTRWLAETKQLVVDADAGQADLWSRPHLAQERLRLGHQALATHERTVRPGDGI